MKLNKKIKLGAILLSSSFLAPFVISASVVDLPKQSFDRSQTDSVDQPTTRLNFNDWMKYVDGNKTLSDLSIPGTHDSGMFASTHFTWGIAKAWAKTQERNFYEQLKSGIRFFDIRIAEDMWIYHGPIWSSYTFEKALKEFVDFLKRYPTETIIIRFKDENWDAAKSDSTKIAEWRNKILTLFNQSWLKPFLFNNTSGDTYVNPTLNEMRGKIYLIDNMYHTILNNDASHGAAWRSNGLEIQDVWETEEQIKMHFISEMLKVSNTKESNTTVINFTSRSKNRSKPYETSRSINKRLYDYLYQDQTILRTGILVFDYPGDAILERVVKTNYTYTDKEILRTDLFNLQSLSFEAPIEFNDFINVSGDLSEFKFEIRRVKSGSTDAQVEVPRVNASKLYVNEAFEKDEVVTVFAFKEIPGNQYYPYGRRYNKIQEEFRIVENRLRKSILDSLFKKIQSNRNRIVELTGSSSNILNYFDKNIQPLYEELSEQGELERDLIIKLDQRLVQDAPVLISAVEQIQQNMNAIIDTKLLFNENQYFSANDFNQIDNYYNNLNNKFNQWIDNDNWYSGSQLTSFKNDFIAYLSEFIQFTKKIIADDQVYSKNNVLTSFNSNNSLKWGLEEYKTKIQEYKNEILEIYNSTPKFRDLTETKNSYENKLNELIAFINFVGTQNTKLVQIHQNSSLNSEQFNVFKDEFVTLLLSQSGFSNFWSKIEEAQNLVKKYNTLVTDFQNYLTNEAFTFASSSIQDEYKQLFEALKQEITYFANWETWETNNSSRVEKLNQLKDLMTTQYQDFVNVKNEAKNAVKGLTFISQTRVEAWLAEIEKLTSVQKINELKNNALEIDKLNQDLVNLTNQDCLHQAQKEHLKTQILDNFSKNVTHLEENINRLVTWMQNLKTLYANNSNYENEINYKYADSDKKENFVLQYQNIYQLSIQNQNLQTTAIQSAIQAFNLSKSQLNGSQNLENKKNEALQSLNALNFPAVVAKHFSEMIKKTNEYVKIDQISAEFKTLASLRDFINQKSNLNQPQKDNLTNQLYSLVSTDNFNSANQESLKTSVNDLDSKMNDFKTVKNDFETYLNSLTDESLKHFKELGAIVLEDESTNLASAPWNVNNINEEIKLVNQIKQILNEVKTNYSSYSEDDIQNKYKQLESLYFNKKIKYYEVLLERNKENFKHKLDDIKNTLSINEYYANLAQNKLDTQITNADSSTIEKIKELIQKLAVIESEFTDSIQQKLSKIDTFESLESQIFSKISTFESQHQKSFDELEDIKNTISSLQNNLNAENNEEIDEKITQLNSILNSLDKILNRINSSEEMKVIQERLYNSFLDEFNKLNILLSDINNVQFSDIYEFGSSEIAAFNSVDSQTGIDELKESISKLQNIYVLVNSQKLTKEKLFSDLSAKVEEIAQNIDSITHDLQVKDNEALINKFNNIKNINLYELTIDQLNDLKNTLTNFEKFDLPKIEHIIAIRSSQVNKINNIKSEIDSIFEKYPTLTDLITQYNDLILQNNIKQLTNKQVDDFIVELESFLNVLVNDFLNEKEDIIEKNDELIRDYNNFSQDQYDYFNENNNINKSLQELKDLYTLIITIRNEIEAFNQSSLNTAQFEYLKNELSSFYTMEQLDEFTELSNNLKENMKIINTEFVNVKTVMDSQQNNPKIMDLYDDLFAGLDLNSYLSLPVTNTIIKNIREFVARAEILIEEYNNEKDSNNENPDQPVNPKDDSGDDQPDEPSNPTNDSGDNQPTQPVTPGDNQGDTKPEEPSKSDDEDIDNKEPEKPTEQPSKRVDGIISVVENSVNTVMQKTGLGWLARLLNFFSNFFSFLFWG
ncbi:hypothetical protein [Mycoplasmopsis pullorum]|uniref:1-phosphatidylinositol phosphodiesterase n=1 Tax=Mycoplasmopsis pullorum TaxID=48003 RepID=A0A1L4FSQ2_9BACT|nr:hypothetical protein [Mycoplasmopsis pullorum]APJ38647.1 hypothetical protein BLA55_03225 [Mycoplasmopsis pullorum]